MAVFTAFQNILPDPNNRISYSGSSSSSDTGASFGPGWASVQLTSKQPVIQTRTNSGRVFSRGIAGHTWQLNIRYNDLTRAEFTPIYTFLIEKVGKLNPFYVALPQYQVAQDSTFAAAMAGGTTITVNETTPPAGRTYLMCSYSGGGNPRPGVIFTISDSNNSNHTKLYMITRTETNSDYNSNVGSQPGSSQRRIHFTPSLTYSTTNASPLDFTSPLVRVTNTTDTNQYDLKTNGLYSFGLKLEEAGA